MEKPATDIYSFEDLRKRGYTYVDKTEIIWPLVNDSIGKQFFMARPRRFGKSLLVSTLQALFEGRRDLFQGLAIEPKWDWTKTWPVLHLDMGSCQSDTIEGTWCAIREMLSSEARRLGLEPRGETASGQFRALIEDLAARNRQQLESEAKRSSRRADPTVGGGMCDAMKSPIQGQMVLLIDEYDKPLLKHLGAPEVNVYRDLLKQFYSIIKTMEGLQRFAFITGVSKFAKVCKTYPQLITALGEKYGMDFEGAFQMIIGKYDGYRFEENAEPVFNPVSLGCCLEGRDAPRRRLLVRAAHDHRHGGRSAAVTENAEKKGVSAYRCLHWPIDFAA